MKKKIVRPHKVVPMKHAIPSRYFDEENSHRDDNYHTISIREKLQQIMYVHLSERKYGETF